MTCRGLGSEWKAIMPQGTTPIANEDASLPSVEDARNDLVRAIGSASGWSDDCERIARVFVRASLAAELPRDAIFKDLCGLGLSRSGAKELLGTAPEPSKTAGPTASIPSDRQPPVADPGPVSTQGKFRKVCIKALSNGYGMYRGQGGLAVDHEGITIAGRHVKSLGARWGIGVLLFVGTAICTLGTFAIGIIPIYFLVEYAILNHEHVFIPWAKVRKYAFDRKRQLVGIDFEGPKWTSPTVMRTPDIARVAQALRHNAPEKDATAGVNCS
jgi:hypothetical protein